MVSQNWKNAFKYLINEKVLFSEFIKSNDDKEDIILIEKMKYCRQQYEFWKQ